MKRLTLLTILLVVVGLTAGFSLEMKPSFTLSASAYVRWGIDLEDMSTGFKNSETVDAYVIMFANELTDTHQGEGDWYGYIQVTDLELFWYANEKKAFASNWTYFDVGLDNVSIEDPDITAKIVGMGGKLTIGVNSDPDLGSNVDFVASIENDDKVDNDVDYYTLDDETTNEWDLGVDYAGPGTYVSYALSDALTVGIEAVSQFDYVGNNDSAYAFALDVLAKFAPLTVTAGVNYGIAYDATATYIDDFGFGLKVAADTDMVDGWVDFDGAMGDVIYLHGNDFAFEVGGGATITLFEVTTAAVAVTYGTGSAVFGSATNPTIPSFDDIDVSFKFTEPAAKGLVDNLDLSIEVYILDIPDSFEYEAIIDGGYLMGNLYPNFKVDFGNDVNTGSTAIALNGEYMYVTVGIDFTGIPLTTIGLYYASNNLMATPDPLLGSIYLQAKVTY